MNDVSNQLPFFDDDWERVREASHAVLSAALDDNDLQTQLAFVELRRVLASLRQEYGDHPVLLETEADFEQDPAKRVCLYRLALEMANRQQVSTLSIRISLARVLIESFGDTHQAKVELLMCRLELTEHGDESDVGEWHELIRRCPGVIADGD